MQLPSWARSVGLSLISALVAGSLVAVVCVVVFTQKINQVEYRQNRMKCLTQQAD